MQKEVTFYFYVCLFRRIKYIREHDRVKRVLIIIIIEYCSSKVQSLLQIIFKCNVYLLFLIAVFGYLFQAQWQLYNIKISAL
jgi:hypothetical protein